MVMPGGRHPADRITRLLADKIRVGFADRVPDQRLDLLFIHAVNSAGNDHHREYRIILSPI